MVTISVTIAGKGTPDFGAPYLFTFLHKIPPLYFFMTFLGSPSAGSAYHRTIRFAVLRNIFLAKYHLYTYVRRYY
jgi:hypothetical protein